MSGLVVVALALAAYGLYAAYCATRPLHRAIADLPEISRQDAILTLTLTLTDDRIVEQRPAIRSEILWSAITRVAETDTGWLLFYGPRHALTVPKHSLDETRQSSFQAFLKTRPTPA